MSLAIWQTFETIFLFQKQNWNIPSFRSQKALVSDQILGCYNFVHKRRVVKIASYKIVAKGAVQCLYKPSFIAIENSLTY